MEIEGVINKNVSIYTCFYVVSVNSTLISQMYFA